MTEPIAVVTGGTKGIGLAFSTRLVSLGYRVIACYWSDPESAGKAEADLGARLHVRRTDLSDPGQTADLAEYVLNEHGAPRVLVNNAGFNADRPFLEMTDQEWRRTIDTNLSAPFWLTRALAPAMLAAGGGNVVNIGATTGMRPRLNGANYCASKAGLLQLTKCLALELAPTIRVNALIPGMIDTEELRTRLRLDDPERMRVEVTEAVPQRRIGSPDEVADALEFLIGPAATYVNGQKLIVDGGQFMW
ncbi:short-chain dehydrogenase [Nocardiopsis terrae]|uniref:Acetoacetyl-CoA reductase/3-oxoacyl-[acyl-carrier protein] reductase n=1 Tax=Nocardiopsis terrae TaxID=372655 RepID=A0ABR9HFK5_9ACTN|nr:SDR family oxidoreductase [Nocardiopsis terrae]MBE1457801.1 acetoacetyl-CoA reductase/3-oxoacyl-[acyl-carrier protein] reductase [Nocardiopsis terrae]GHC84194.1 short-chain dehydrogenase [Nocardiopsis terrae]